MHCEENKTPFVSIEDLENELEYIRSQINAKTLMLNARDKKIASTCKCPAQLWPGKEKQNVPTG